MLDHFGEREASAAVIGAIAGTAEAGKAIAAAI